MFRVNTREKERDKEKRGGDFIPLRERRAPLQLVSQMNGRFFSQTHRHHAERIEHAVIYREIHLLRLLQQTLPSIKAEGAAGSTSTRRAKPDVCSNENTPNGIYER